MRIIVSDTSCMIHLEKAALLNAVLALPYTFVMPDTLFEDEWLWLSESDKKMLCDSGLEVRELPGVAVTRATAHFNRHKRLTLNDCFALALAQDIDDSILLTGDNSLRTVAERNGIEVHGGEASLGKNFNALDDLAEEIPRPNIDGSQVAYKPDHIVLSTSNIELVNCLAQEFH